MEAFEAQPASDLAPIRTSGHTAETLLGGRDGSVEELAVVTSEIQELSAAVQRLLESSRTIKILTVPVEHVHKTAIVFRRLGIQGVVRDPMGLLVVTVSATD